MTENNGRKNDREVRDALARMVVYHVKQAEKEKRARRWTVAMLVSVIVLVGSMVIFW